MRCGDVCRVIGTGQLVTVERPTEDGVNVACWWFNKDAEYRWGYIAAAELIPLLGSHWPEE